MKVLKYMDRKRMMAELDQMSEEEVELLKAGFSELKQQIDEMIREIQPQRIERFRALIGPLVDEFVSSPQNALNYTDNTDCTIQEIALYFVSYYWDQDEPILDLCESLAVKSTSVKVKNMAIRILGRYFKYTDDHRERICRLFASIVLNETSLPETKLDAFISRLKLIGEEDYISRSDLTLDLIDMNLVEQCAISGQ
jgi:hypothetical protein